MAGRLGRRIHASYGDRIHCAHIKGVQVVRRYTRNGLLGGHKPMGDKHNGWNFVTPGTARDATASSRYSSS